MRLTIRSGGQTGVDRAALDAAIAANVPYVGWCPRGGAAEDLTEPPGLLLRYPFLRETPSEDPRQRTTWNVRDSDATLLLVRGADLPASPGTEFTRQNAEMIYRKPCRIVRLDVEASARGTFEWLSDHVNGDEDAMDLNVAGPRESQSPGIYDLSLAYVRALLEALTA